MSKLFEAISKIEVDAGQAAVESPFSGRIVNPAKTEPKTAPRRVLILAFLILVLSVMAGFGLLFVSKKIAVGPRSVEGEARITTAHAPPPASAFADEPAKASARSGKMESIVRAERDRQPLDIQRTEKNVVPPPLQQAASVEKKQVPPTTRRVSGSLEVPVAVPAMVPSRVPSQTASNPLILSVRQKRLLLRAEKLRKAGAYDRALGLYRKIWRKSRNPLVANNLAAILMEKGQYSEARRILKEAIEVSPHDQDLRFNLAQLDALDRSGGR